MDFSVELLHNMENDMKLEIEKVLKTAKVSSASELNETSLSKLNKAPLVNFVTRLVSLLEKNVELCKSAAGKIDSLKTEQIDSQKRLLEVQKDQIKSVQSVVKTEMKSFADIVKKDNKERNQRTEKSVEKVIRSVNDEEKRSKNLMIYGCEEDESKAESIGTVVRDLYNSMNLPIVKTLDIYRMGKKEPGKTRAIRVEYDNTVDVQFALANAHKLKSNGHPAVFLGPDRSREERLAHNKLVKQMKELIQNDSNKYYFIRDKKICHVDKFVSSSSSN